METFFLVCAALGGVVLVLQLVLSFAGIAEAHQMDLPVHLDDPAVSEGLDLLGMRALAAGFAFFGVGGLFGVWLGVGGLLALPFALVLGGGALVGTAWAVRAIRGLDQDATPLVEETIGESGEVYLAIPAAEGGVGKVHVPLRGRLAEFPAVTRGAALPTGTPVMVTDVIEGDTLVVAALTLLPEVDDVSR